MDNRLKKGSCNKTYCKSCIFHPDHEKALKLEPKRINEIMSYLVKFEASHVCHVTEKTCYGALEVQAKVGFIIGMNIKPTVESFLDAAEKSLQKPQTENG